MSTLFQNNGLRRALYLFFEKERISAKLILKHCSNHQSLANLKVLFEENNQSRRRQF